MEGRRRVRRSIAVERSNPDCASAIQSHEPISVRILVGAHCGVNSPARAGGFWPQTGLPNPSVPPYSEGSISLAARVATVRGKNDYRAKLARDVAIAKRTRYHWHPPITTIPNFRKHLR
jgi:hypothetical protein